ncbi:MAG: 50S ribosomal protein L31e [Candidatus Bathyarchaeota archaeon]|nr:50S ribosomal protein L31e [Candidatus Termiticorpusculum sp.]
MIINASEEQQLIQETEILEEPKELTTIQEEILPTEILDEPKETVAKTEKTKQKKKDDDIVEERIYTIPLQKALVRPPKKRAPRAMQLVKLFVIRHMKMAVTVTEDDEELPQLIITQKVNEKIWSKSIEKPPRKIRVRVTKDRSDTVTVYLAENE